ncbi:MAG: hypothetical protein ACRENU_00360 [Gemmatimonadaceae bacterium]
MKGLFGRLIDHFNPGITLLMLVWVVGLTARRYLVERDQLSGIADRGLTSLAFVVPLMLIGWAVLAVADRYFELGIFPKDDEQS